MSKSTGAARAQAPGDTCSEALWSVSSLLCVYRHTYNLYDISQTTYTLGKETHPNHHTMFNKHDQEIYYGYIHRRTAIKRGGRIIITKVIKVITSREREEEAIGEGHCNALVLNLGGGYMDVHFVRTFICSAYCTVRQTKETVNVHYG